METLIEEIQIYEERQPSGQWLKSITFRLPIIDSDISTPIGKGLDSDSHVETVCCLYHQKKDFISVPYEPKDDDYLKNR